MIDLTLSEGKTICEKEITGLTESQYDGRHRQDIFKFIEQIESVAEDLGLKYMETTLVKTISVFLKL